MPRVARQTLVVHPQGLHARPAALFVQLAKRFASAITVTKGRQRVDGKSIMGLLTLAVETGSQVRIAAEGPDAQEAVDRLCHFLSRRFDSLDVPPKPVAK